MISQLRKHKRINPMEQATTKEETLNSRKRYGKCITRKMTAEDWEKYGAYNPVPKQSNHSLMGKPRQKQFT